MDYLLISGHLDEAGDFVNDWWGSPEIEGTHQPEHAAPTGWDAVALDRSGEVLTEAVASVSDLHRCGSTLRSHVTALLPVPAEAATIAVRHHDRPVFTRAVPQSATLRMADTLTDRPARARVEVPVDIDGPAPGEGAYLVSYWQAPHQPIAPLGVTELSGNTRAGLNVDLTSVGGGDNCKLIVVYFDGVRAARSTSKALYLAERSPRPEIVAPASGSRLFDDTWLSLVGRLGGDGDPEKLEWLVDGEVVGTGPKTGVTGLAVGRHTVQARYGEAVEEVALDVVPAPTNDTGHADWAPPWRSPHALN